ncbi:hypothetical protein PJK47_30675, partial [Mycobacterium kansasii]
MTTSFPGIGVPAAGFLFSAMTPHMKDTTPKNDVRRAICFILKAISQELTDLNSPANFFFTD